MSAIIETVRYIKLILSTVVKGTEKETLKAL